MIDFEQNIPIPQHSTVRKSRYSHMKTGDSLFFADRADYDRTRSAMAHIAKRRGWKLFSRQVEGGWRIWRVA